MSCRLLSRLQDLFFAAMAYSRLPSELLCKIAAHLDQDSSASLALVHRRSLNLVSHLLEPFRTDVWSEPRYLLSIDIGLLPRSLDLSNCFAPSAEMEFVITCKSQLDVINTSLTRTVECFKEAEVTRNAQLHFAV